MGKSKYQLHAPRPRARLTRFCHSKVDEVSCNSFLSFMKRYDEQTAHQIIEEALVPDIADARGHKLFGHRTAIKSALKNFTQDDFACQVLGVPIHKPKNEDLIVKEQLTVKKANTQIQSPPEDKTTDAVDAQEEQ